MEQSNANRGFKVAASRSMTPRPFGAYQFDRGMQAALERVKELRPAPSYSDKFKK
jgi:hypothetical protein